jgi:hypothetical protein
LKIKFHHLQKAGFLFSALILFPLCSPSSRAMHDWKIMQSSDTLDLFMNEQFVGTFNHTVAMAESGSAIVVTSRLTVSGGGSPPAAGGAMELLERRTYGLDGKLVRAFQELQSASGVSRWNLVKEKEWKLSITTGGQERAQAVANINENLEATYALHQGIINRTIKKDDAFFDTTFDLTSASIVYVTTRCVETPSRANGSVWTFVNVNNVTGREERWKLDSCATTLYEEIWPMTARKKTRGAPGGARKSTPPLFEAFQIPSERSSDDSECIRLTLDSALVPDSSVLVFYTRSGNSWVLSGVPRECLDSAVPPSKDSRHEKVADFRLFTSATPTMQSDDKRLQALADSLVSGKSTRCDSINACFAYVMQTLAKRYTATFSNALETLKAGYGDCGEHAVLLGALLRAVHIPARVVLGLVYVPDRKAYLYHAWTMARSAGKWVFADAALGAFPAVRGRVPLVIDDTGENIVRIAKLIGRIKIDYVKATQQ